MLRAMAGDPDKVRQTAETIARNGQALTRLVEDLLDVSRITRGDVHLDWQPVDFAALVDAAAAGIRPTAEAKGVRFLVKSVTPSPASRETRRGCNRSSGTS